MVEEEKEDQEEKDKYNNDDQEKQFRKDSQSKSGIDILLKKKPEVEVVTEILKVIDRLVEDLQAVSGDEASRNREDGACLTCDYNGAT